MASIYEKQIMSINEAATYMNMSVEAFKEDFNECITYPPHARRNQGHVVLSELKEASKRQPHTPQMK